MPWPFHTVTDLSRDADALRRGHHGVIEMVGGRLVGVHLRPWPKLVSLPQVWLAERWLHDRRAGDRCLLYYDQPFGSPGFLSLKYVVSYRDATLATFHGAVVVLDEIARLRRAHAIVCHLSNARISDRLMRRWGWEAHLPDHAGRHFIKRFYGTWAEPQAVLAYC